MRFFKLLLIICVCFSACKKKQSIDADIKTEKTDSLALTKADISKLKYKDIGLDEKANPVTSNWQAYLTITNGIENIKQADFTFFNADKELFDSTIKDFEETIPEAINSNPVQSRILAIKTFLYKFQEIEAIATTTKDEKLLVIKELFISFSNLNLQINKKIEKDNQSIEKPY